MMDLLKLSRIFLLLTIVAFLGCKEEKTNEIVENRISGPALGTSYNLIYVTDKEIDFQAEIDSIFDVMNLSLSTYIPISDISKVNDGDTTLVIEKCKHWPLNGRNLVLATTSAGTIPINSTHKAEYALKYELASLVSVSTILAIMP